jgi:RND family efflux transporter MFP subunit
MNKKQKIISITTAVLIILFILWFIFDGVPVEAYKVTPQDAIKGVTVTGTVKSREDVLVTTNIIGIIEKIYIKEGDYVKKGQLIATLIRREAEGYLESAQGKVEAAYWELEDLLTEPRQQEVEIAKAKVKHTKENIEILEYTLGKIRLDLKDSQIDEERYKTLEEAGAVSKRELEQKTLKRMELENTIGEKQGEIHQTQADLTEAEETLSLTVNKIKIQKIKAAKGQVYSAEGDTKASEGNLEKYIITAPVSGIITDKILHTGDIASPTSPIVRLIVPEQIYLSMEVEENETEFIKKGQNALAVFDAFPEKVYECFVKEIVKQVNPSTGTFETKLTRPKENINLDVGMTVDATIITGKYKKILIIPTDFITQKDNKTYVFTKFLFWARKTYIKTENFDNNRTKIIDGLKKGDIILKSIEKNKLKNNKHIKIIGYYKL